MTSPELEIVWDGGSLDLMGENDTDNGPVTIHALADGTDWGNPESVRRELWRALSDGSISAIDSWKNRTIPLRLKLSAGDSLALAGGEKPLHMLSGVRRAELRWTPPNVFAAPAVFIVTASDLSHNMDDLAENRSERYYTLTLSCLPFARSLDEVTIEVQPPFIGAPSVITTWGSLAGWTSSDPAVFALSSSGGNVVVTLNAVATGQKGIVRYSATFTTTKRYVAIKSTGYNDIRINQTIGGVPTWLSPRLAGTSPDGTWRFYNMGVGAVINAIEFYMSAYLGAPATTTFYDLGESDSPSTAAGRQSLRSLGVIGSVAAPGSLLIERRTSPDTLGETVIYTGPKYDPRLSIGRQDPAGITPSALSGVTTLALSSFTFIRNASDFPSGIYTLWGNPLPDNPIPDNVSWTVAVSLIDAGGGTITSAPVFTTTTRHLSGSRKRLQPFGLVTLPGADLPSGSPYYVKFVLTPNVPTFWDEGLVFHQDGTLTVIDTNANGATRVLVEAATLEHNARVMRGSGAASQDVPVSMLSELRNWGGTHMFTPDETYLYVGTTGAVDAKVTGSFRPTWHTHPTQ